MPNATDTLTATRSYGLLGHPAELAAHADRVGPLPGAGVR